MNSSLPYPKRIGTYDIVGVIGRGGMGTVFKGIDPRIGRSVAIKVLTAAPDDPDLLQRFYREAKYTGSLQHQNIVTVYELGHENGAPYLVMEYLEGVSLDAVIESAKPLPLAEKLGIIVQVCTGLSYAHKRDLVHRDIKPANIVIIEDSIAKIVDFGIARLEGNRLTRTGRVVGSLNYMSPEQLDGGLEIDLRTDIYSTGVVLFQLLTGALPFAGGTTAATLRKIIQDPPPPLGSYINDCPQELEAIIQKSLAKNRDDRYATADDLAVDLGRLREQLQSQLLSEYLREAANSLRSKDFGTARQQALQALRISPNNTEGNELFRLIKHGQEQQQVAVQLQKKAEEALHNKKFDQALKFIDEGLRLDSNRTNLMHLRNAVLEAQSRVTKYRELLEAGEAALRLGDLNAAKQSLEDAFTLLPEDAAVKELATRIAAQIKKRAQEQEAREAQRQFALKVNTVEKAFADARMLLSLDQAADAVQAIEKVSGEVSQLPAQWGEQTAVLLREAQERMARVGRTSEFAPPVFRSADSEPSNWGGSSHSETADLPALNATMFLGQKRASNDKAGGFENTRSSYATSGQKSEIAPELLEFLQPENANWTSRSTVWLGLAGAVFVIAVLWLIFRPATSLQSQPQSQPPSTPSVVTSNYTYAEINAEPWAVVKEITPVSAETQSAIGSPTPLRIKLAPGQYSVTLEGPNHERKRAEIIVPTEGGVTSFVLFQKPDLQQLLK
jgi:serine/threonine protein kinase